MVSAHQFSFIHPLLKDWITAMNLIISLFSVIVHLCNRYFLIYNSIIKQNKSVLKKKKKKAFIFEISSPKCTF